MTETHFFHIVPAGPPENLSSVEEALASLNSGGYIWLHYFMPEREELTRLIDPLGLHPLAIEDCYDNEQVPKIEDFPKNTFILYNTFHYDNSQLTIEEIDLFIGENFLVTVSRHDIAVGKQANGFSHMLDRDIESVRQGPAFLMHTVLDHIVDQKFLAIEKLEDELEASEEVILSDLRNFKPGDLLDLRRNLLKLRKSLFHEREILVKICRKDCPFIPEKALFHYRDIYDHLSKFFELTEAYRDMVTGLMEMYLSMLNNEMAQTSNLTNISVRRLTFITTIFMPLTLLAGIGGMSEWSMMTGPDNWKYTYPLFLLGLIILGIISYYTLKWLEKKNKVKDGAY